MGFVDAVKQGFANYVNFSGRACRSEYWYWLLFLSIVSIVASVIDDSSDSQGILTVIVGVTTFLPDLSVGVRRLHDLDRSGWWILLSLIPLVGPIILLIWFCIKGTNGPNRFGEDRLGSLGQISPRPA